MAILRIDNGACIVYTEARRKAKTASTVKKTGKKGLIPMVNCETPPNHLAKIYTERNESKDLVR